MSKTLQVMKTEVNRARNLSYFGKYIESVKEFDKIIQKIENQIFSIGDKLLITQWNKLLERMRNEKGLADIMISTLSGDVQQPQPKRRQYARDRQSLQQQKHIYEQPYENRKQQYPFGQEPFRKQVHEDDEIYNRKQRETRDQRDRMRDQLQKQERDRQWDEKQAEIWPKKQPKKAKKSTPSYNYNYNATNNKSNLNNNSNSHQNPNDKRQYQKPWLKNAGGKKNCKDSGDQKKNFLNSVYPDGKGPDTDLISQLERQVVQLAPNISFDDIAELQKAKDVLQEAVLLPLAMPQLFQGIRRAWKGVLLFGPPGTGKTLLAKAIASTGKTTFFNVTSSTLASKWKGQSQKMVRLLFEMARFYAPSTIFIDEIDALASRRGEKEDESSRKVKTELMARIDGATTGSADDKLIVVIGATNRPWDLDEAIRRRLEKRIYIPLPTEIGRREMVKISLKGQKIEESLSIEEIVRKTEGYSGADLANLCREAAYMPMRRKLKKEGGLGSKIKDANWQQEFEKEVNVPLSMEDFNEAIKNVKPSVGKSELKNYEEWMNEFGEQGTK